jgi:hypothetical protein
MKLEAGMTKQGVRNLSDLGPKKKKLAAGDGGGAERDGRTIEAPQPLPETPVVATKVTVG